MTDVSGENQYSTILKIKHILNNKQSNIQGNIVTNKVSLNLNYDEHVAVHFYDLSGRKVLSPSINNTKTPINLDVSMLQPGQYFLRINTQTDTETIRFLKQ